MKEQAINNTQVYYRIVAMWVLCEAMLGGIIHALRIPVSGLVVGSAAVICISLIAFYVPAKGAIIKATFIVAIFKMMLSPQAPVLAYAAVFFQGVLGELLFWNRRAYRLACLGFGFLALLESGFQRIIVLTVVYGNNLWRAVNSFLNDLTGQEGFTDYSLYLVAGYVSLHVIAGLVVGWWAGIIPNKILQWQIDFAACEFSYEEDQASSPKSNRKSRKLKTSMLIIWIALTVLYIQSYFGIGNPILPARLPLQILWRSAIIVLGWYFLVGPMAKFFLQRWLSKKQAVRQTEIQNVLALLPETRRVITNGWKFSSQKTGISKLGFFLKLILAKSLVASAASRKVFILTGDTRSGKTTSLRNWIEGRHDVHGILTPVIDGERFFLDIETKEEFRMQAIAGEESLIIGRYNFSKQNFEKASSIIEDSVRKDGWLVIDEIGPLELKGEGFHDVLLSALARPFPVIILVVRRSILEEVKMKFEIEDAVVLNSVTTLATPTPKVLITV